MKVQIFTMKSQKTILLLCWLILTLSIALPVHSHTLPKLDKIDLEEAFHRIGEKYNAYFNYDRSIASNIEVEYLEDQHQSLDEALSYVLRNTDLGYRIYDERYVVVFQNNVQGIESLKNMIGHMQGLVKEKEISQRRQVTNALEPIRTLSAVALYNKRVVFNTTGTVTDQNGEPLIGVNVLVVGTNQGTATDFEGRFELNDLDENAVLLISYIGYQTQEVPVNGNPNLSITLVSDSQLLDEVVVIGYGTQRRRDLTGSVSSVSAEDIARTSSSNAMQAMQAKVPGLDIQQSDGQAGSGISLNLRGNRSISASNSPLILVDGIEYGSTLDINPSDIESMDILKDASSTAIYGTKGANGVIIITTKRGTPGKTKINLNAFVSSNSPTNIPGVMYGTKEVQRLIDKSNYQADAASGNWGGSNLTIDDILTESLDDGTSEREIYNNGSYTDWLDIILQNGLTQNYELSASGGNEKTNFSLSLGTMYEEGLMKNDALDRYNVKTVVDHQVNDFFKLGLNALLTYKSHDSRSSSVFGQSLKMTTITRPYLTDGEINENPNPRYAAHVNPLMDEIPGNHQHNIQSTRVFSNGYVEIKPLEDLVFKSTFAIDRSNLRDGLYQDFKSVARHQSPGTSNISSTRDEFTRYTWENTLTYDAQFGNTAHDLTFLLGHSMNQSVRENTSTFGDAGAEHYYQSSFYDLSKINTPTTRTNYIQQGILSYFSRLNYIFRDKYLLTASIRADGSSTLAEGNKWGYFPSAAVAWRLSEESFLSTTPWLDNMKLRASWGISGNAAIGPYETLQALSSYPIYYFLGNKDVAGNIPDQLGNQDLKWETTNALNFGVDFGIWNSRVYGSIDYFISHTSDLLLYRSVPGSSVFPTVISNIGETKGKGLEIALGTSVVRSRDFNWDINWSYSTYNDEVYKLYDGLEKDINGNVAYIVGQPVSTFYDYEAQGNWGVGEFEKYVSDLEASNGGVTANYISSYGTPGTIKVADKNRDGTLDDDDKIIYGRSPKHILGMSNTIGYRDFSLSVLVFARTGGYISYGLNTQLNFESANWGDLDYWTVNNLDAKFPNPGSVSSPHTNYGGALRYEKADYVKIKDITLGYNLPREMIGRVGLGSLKLFGSLKNYLTFSKIDNYDPERGGSINFPLAKQLVFGVNIEF